MKDFQLPPIKSFIQQEADQRIKALEQELEIERSRQGELRHRLKTREALRKIWREADEFELEKIADKSGNSRHHHIVDGGESREFEWNAPRDTQWANSDERMQSVVHVFHKEWFGMRAAAGALPGNKLAISADTNLSSDALAGIVRRLSDAGVTAIICHGYSNAMEYLIKALHTTGFNNINLVWHGAAGMWIWEEERRLFFGARELVKGRVIRRMHGMRPGTDVLIGDHAWKPQLLNMPPNVFFPKFESSEGSFMAFAPSWNLVHKNLMSNVMAAVVNPSISKVIVMAKELSLPEEFAQKIESLPAQSQTQMMQAMNLSDIVLNVSLVDCHPMVEMEALAAGTPCLRGQLHLDSLEDHDYVRHTLVSDPLSVREISGKISEVLAIPQAEMRGLLEDYSTQLKRLAVERYLEFVA